MGIWSHSVNHFFCLLIHVHLNTDVHWLNRSQSAATYTPDPPKARESSRSRTLVCGTILIPFPSPQQYWYTQFNLYISNEKVTGNNNFSFWIYIDCVILHVCTERRFRKILKLLSFDLFLNDEASIQLDASFEKIRTETLQNKLEEWKKTTPFFF